MRALMSMVLIFSTLTGCSVLERQDESDQLQVYGHLNFVDQVRLTVLYPESKSRAAGAAVTVLDDLGRVYLTEALDAKGQLQFRFPSRGVHVDVLIETDDGWTGRKRIELNDKVCRRRFVCY